MLVKQRMTTHPITITTDTPVSESLSFMRQNNIRRLPVLNKKGELAGIVSEKDLLYASPSPATSLSVYEVGYLLTKLKVKTIMAKDVITVAANAPLEEAARIMVDNKIGGLPVMKDGELVGIITETDIFTTILEMLGAREQGLRVTIHAENKPGLLNRITRAIAELGGDIIALGTFYGDDRATGIVMSKLRGVAEEPLLAAMDKLGIQVEDIRSV
ncbi:MAG TPA: CBS domain-containing protein [Thermoflexia bacterium]|nr:CBS domain-containing protein [Thermoflexia bacterium]